MRLVTYIQEAVRPGGTPTRYLIWVSVILVCQALASVIPSEQFYKSLNASHYVLGGTLILALAVQFFQKDSHKIMAAYCLYIVGLVVSTITISMGITSLSGIVFMLTWAMTLFIAERREYISFDLVTLFMVLMLISTVILLMFNPSMGVADNGIILGTGALFTAADIYLVYIDFGRGKNFYQESRKTFTDLDILSSKLSEILTADKPLDELLWSVTHECVPFLGLEECVIYLFDNDKKRLIQVAAYGDKTVDGNEIVNPIEIEPGKGIVGRCFSSAESILIEETKHDPDYIVDDAFRNSELAAPIISNGQVIGVIDSEHTVKGFFKDRHKQAFQVIASFCGIKITEDLAKQSIIDAQTAREEAIRYKELDELKNRFITNISHDLKTPLSLIKAPAMQIASIADKKQVKKHASYILKNTEHLLRVVNQLLQLNRVDKGLNELYLEKVDLGKLIGKINTQYSGLAEKDAVEFEVITAQTVVVTDSFRLEQIIHNLVHNAFRYTGKGGKVKLEVQQEDNLLQVVVSDNGPGIADELRSKIFDRFYKVDENNHEGTGIGLSLVKEYALSLSGDVTVIDPELGGASFQVLIPVERANQDLDSEDWEEVEISSGGKPVMLVVEDHADLNDFICTFFENDFKCISAFDGQEALLQISEQSPDIIISDLMMPNMDGNEFVRKIKESEEFGHIPVVVLSAKSQTESRIDLYDLGADNYLVKPFDVQELNSIVHNVLDQRKKLKSMFHQTLHVTQAQVSTEIKPNEEVDEFIQSAVNFVMENLDENSLSVKDLGEHLGLGRNKVQRQIKLLTQLTPVEFIRSIRLNEARELLRKGELNVSEVAYAVGFNNLSYFTRSFKSEFGNLPSEEQNVNA